MKKAGSKKRSILATLGFLLACGLVISFSLHTIQTEHTHPGSHTGVGVHTESQEDGFGVFSEYLHGAEKKLFIFALFAFLLLGVFISLHTAPWILAYLYLFFKKSITQMCLRFSFRTFNLYVQLFSSGLLNTKTY